jgi:hypothetical protein
MPATFPMILGADVAGTVPEQDGMEYRLWRHVRRNQSFINVLEDRHGRSRPMDTVARERRR